VLWRIEDGVLDGLSPQQVVLMIGTNNSGTNTSREIADGVESIVRELKSRLRFADIIVLGIFPRGAQQHDRLRQVNIGANRLIAQRTAFDERVHFFDIGHVFVDETGNLSTDIMPDLLHLSVEGYRRWADALAPLLEN
jgi:beta-glucosidase